MRESLFWICGFTSPPLQYHICALAADGHHRHGDGPSCPAAHCGEYCQRRIDSQVIGAAGQRDPKHGRTRSDPDRALDSLRLSCDTLQAGDYASSLAHSILAIERAERAFFDPTMVSMLYFPDEHKYAIYMPLFVPISVPLFMALWKEAREARQRRKAGKAKVD
ncbi:phosphatidylinositol-glycan biosynthesis class S protein-domain-containing protein [Jimgerdemannia flammicorona]|uniref:Phosphatidylinositol-glycan biosynthesis class S protein-domain-containing protein n=1 Tax=Jimgerdemannia flammicorona TaxID=994334 RepID=A0A433A336_9FUNG|nr:phosphatidylinositol-glycan biosynthesis class S protein-domain-containing protein [Jimgerdemannia flammicorona]